jgi:hypothetical protein
MAISFCGSAAKIRSDAINDNAREHNHHPDERHEVRRKLCASSGAVVVVESRACMGDQVRSQAQADDEQAEQRDRRESPDLVDDRDQPAAG